MNVQLVSTAGLNVDVRQFFSVDTFCCELRIA
jgi:hypothetical protein